MGRFSRSFYDNQLVQNWVTSVDGLEQRLTEGVCWADVGCGSGTAVIRLAEAFPASVFVGYDNFEGQLHLAREAAADAGVSDRVRFELRDAADGIPGSYEVISTFDVVHDAVDPPALVAAIRRALKQDGTYLMLEMNSSDDPDQNVGPLATLLYGVSIVYCMTTSLAHGGAGLGTCGLPAARVQELCVQAGFSTVHRLDLQDAFNSLYVIRR